MIGGHRMSKSSKAVARIEASGVATRAGMQVMADLHRYAHDRASEAVGEAARLYHASPDTSTRNQIRELSRDYEHDLLGVLNRAGHDIVDRIDRGR